MPQTPVVLLVLMSCTDPDALYCIPPVCPQNVYPAHWHDKPCSVLKLCKAVSASATQFSQAAQWIVMLQQLRNTWKYFTNRE
jgi:hypothetical protein